MELVPLHLNVDGCPLHGISVGVDDRDLETVHSMIFNPPPGLISPLSLFLPAIVPVPLRDERVESPLLLSTVGITGRGFTRRARAPAGVASGKQRCPHNQDRQETKREG